MKKDRIIAMLAVACAVSLAVMVLALCRDRTGGEFTPPPFETAAQAGQPEVPEGRGYQELDVRVFRVCLCGEIRTQEGAAEVWFTNPADNSVWLRLRILDEEGNILGQTGLLRPGEYVRWVELEQIRPGMPVTLKVMAYEPETYCSAGALVFHTWTAAQ